VRKRERDMYGAREIQRERETDRGMRETEREKEREGQE
jgi:hypothetical protein